MSLNFYALQRLSDLHSHREEGGRSLGVAIFRLAETPPSGSYTLNIYERDQELSESAREGRRGATPSGSEDDLLGSIECTVEGGAVRFAAEVTNLTGADDDPTVTIVIMLEDEAEPPTSERRWTVPVSAAARRDDHDQWLEFGLREEGQGWEHQAPVRLRGGTGEDPAWWPEERETGPEWDGRSAPAEGQVWQGRKFDGRRRLRLAPGVFLRANRMGRAGPDEWGFIYGGKNAYSSLTDASDALAAEFRAEGDHYRALATEVCRALKEGGASAVNTYDNQFVTLGMGWGATANTAVMSRLRGRTAELMREVLSGLACFDAEARWDDERFNPRRSPQWDDAARAVRLDSRVYARYIQLAEHRSHCFEVVRANLVSYVEKDCVARSTAEDLAWANELAAADGPPERRAILTIVSYCHHGRPAWIPRPARELFYLFDEGELARQAQLMGVDAGLFQDPQTGPVARAALALKRHAELSWRRNQHSSNKLVERSLGRKVECFEEVMAEDTGAPFPFDPELARQILPGFVGKAGRTWASPDVWQLTEEEPAAGRVFLAFREGRRPRGGRRARRTYYVDFGPPVLAEDDPGVPRPRARPQRSRRSRGR